MSKVSYQSLRTILFLSLYYKTTILCTCSFAPFIQQTHWSTTTHSNPRISTTTRTPLEPPRPILPRFTPTTTHDLANFHRCTHAQPTTHQTRNLAKPTNNPSTNLHPWPIAVRPINHYGLETHQPFNIISSKQKNTSSKTQNLN